MYRAQIITSWAIDAEGDNVPQASLDYNISFIDVTGQPVENIQPTPNTYVIEITAPLATIQQMESDGVTVLWYEEITIE